MIMPPTTNLNRDLDKLKDHHCISPSTRCICILENKIQQIQKNSNLRIKWLKTTYHKVLSSAIHELLHLFLRSSIRTCISTKSSIRIGSRSKTIVGKRKLLLVKYIYKKTTNKKIDVIVSHAKRTEWSRWCSW